MDDVYVGEYSLSGDRDDEYTLPPQPSQLLHSRKKVRTLNEYVGDNNSSNSSRPMSRSHSRNSSLGMNECVGDNNGSFSRPMSRSHSRNSSLGMMSSHSSFDMLDQIRYVPQQVQDDSYVSYFKSITANRPLLRSGASVSPDLVGPEIQITIPAPSTNPYLKRDSPSSGTKKSYTPPTSRSTSSKGARVSPTFETKRNTMKILRNMSDERDNPSIQQQSPKNRLIWIAPYKERPRYMTDFEQEGIVGTGNFSSVFKARSRLDGCLYAVKRLKAKITDTTSNGLREVYALSALQGCENIIRYHGCWVEDQHLWIQTELCMSYSLDIFVLGIDNRSHRNSPSFGFTDLDLSSHGRSSTTTPTNTLSNITEYAEGDLATLEGESPYGAKRVDGCIGIPEELAWVIIEQVTKALSFLHSKGVVHLDIRPANVFIASAPFRCTLGSSTSYQAQNRLYTDETINNLSKGLIEGTLMLKVGDFGFCCRTDDLPSASEGEARYCSGEMISSLEASLPSVSLASTFGLKAALTAPAIESSDNNNKVKIDLTKADIFSLGASVYELCKGSILAANGAADGSNEWHDIRNGKLDTCVTKKYSDEFTSFLMTIMEPDPSMRPSSSELNEHCKMHRKFIEAGHIQVETRRENLRDLEDFLGRMNIQVESNVIKQVTELLKQNIS